MAISRVEKFKEYRKSIISEPEITAKTTIDTNLVVQKNENPSLDLNDDIALSKKISSIRMTKRLLLLSFVLIILILLIVFGIICFLGESK